MYTRSDFGKELKEKVSRKVPIPEIGHWTYSIYMEHISEIDDDEFDDFLLTLSTMGDDPQFEFTYEELNKISDDLIAGNDFNMDDYYSR